MIKKIRYGLFETNSSSTHSMTWRACTESVPKQLDEDLYILYPSEYTYDGFDIYGSPPDNRQNLYVWINKFAYLYFRLSRYDNYVNDHKWCMARMHEIFKEITGKNVFVLCESDIRGEDVISFDEKHLTFQSKLQKWDFETNNYIYSNTVMKTDVFSEKQAREKFTSYFQYNSFVPYTENAEDNETYTFFVFQDTDFTLMEKYSYHRSIEEDIGLFKIQSREKFPDKIFMTILEEYIKNDCWDYQILYDEYPPRDDVRHIEKNGNMYVCFFGDGTRIILSEDEKFNPEYPLSLDVKITDKCSHNCSFCYENSSPKGKDADKDTLKLFEKLPFKSEVAIGGGNPLESRLLKKLPYDVDDGPRYAVTVNSKDITDDIFSDGGFLNYFGCCLYALGISVTKVDDNLLERIEKLKEDFHIVIHVIAGVISIDELKKLYDRDLRLLILGYKNIGRGKQYKDENVNKRIEELSENLDDIREHFRVTAFDNLALEQLDVKRKTPVGEWDILFQGEEGEFSMYIDLVKKEFSYSSYDNRRYPIKDGMTIKDMFDFIRKNRN